MVRTMICRSKRAFLPPKWINIGLRCYRTNWISNDMDQTKVAPLTLMYFHTHTVMSRNIKLWPEYQWKYIHFPTCPLKHTLDPTFTFTDSCVPTSGFIKGLFLFHHGVWICIWVPAQVSFHSKEIKWVILNKSIMITHWTDIERMKEV